MKRLFKKNTDLINIRVERRNTPNERTQDVSLTKRDFFFHMYQNLISRYSQTKLEREQNLCRYADNQADKRTDEQTFSKIFKSCSAHSKACPHRKQEVENFSESNTFFL